MRIGLVIHTFNNTRGGKEILTWNLVKKLLEKGDRVDVVANDYEEIDHPKLNFHGVPMVGKPLGLHRATFAWFARRKVASLDVDFVYTNGKTGYGDVIRIGGLPLKSHLRVLAEQQPTRFRKKLFEFRKSLSFSKAVALKLERRSFCEAEYDKVIVASNFIKRELLKSYPDVSPEKVDVIYSGFDPDKFNLDKRRKFRRTYRRKLDLHPERKTLIFVANNFSLKGLDRALEFLRGSRDYELLVVGSGNPPAIDDELDERVKYLGEVESVTPYYAAADALILPTRSDGFGMVVLEAFAMGLYVLVSDRAGAAELIDDPVKGQVFRTVDQINQHDINEFAGSDYVTRRADAVSEYTWDKMTDRYRESFRSVVRDETSRSGTEP